MTQGFALEFASSMTKLILVASLVGIPASAQQATSTQSSSEVALVFTLPDAPSSQDSQNGVPPQEQAPANSSSSSVFQGSIGPMPPILTKTPLTFHDKFRIYEHQAFGPPALVFPALGAVDLKTAQELLRHANSRITLDVYTRAISANKREANNKVMEMVIEAGRTRLSAPS